MLDSTLKSQLVEYLTRLRHPIELVATLDTSSASQELRALLADIASCSPLVSVKEDGADPRAPSFTVATQGCAPRVAFAGIPLGHEFTSLVLALLQAGGHPPKVSEEEAARIAAVSGPLAFEVFVSLSCHNCPDLVQALNLMAVLNPNISCVTVDGALFQDEVTAKGVMAVPAVFLNGQPFGAGRMTLAEILAKVDTEGTARTAQALSEKDVFDVLVVGGGPAGSAAAVYAARKGIRTGLLAERLGGQVNDTMGIENYISVLETTGPRLAADLEAHVRHYGVDLMTAQRAVAIEPADGVLRVRTAAGALLRAKSLVVAPGARWRNVNVPGEEEYRNKGVAYCPHCDGPLFKGKRTAVIGGGNSGVEAAIDLAGIVEHVTLVEFADQLKADAVLVAKLKSLANVTVHVNAQTTEITGDGSKVNGLKYKDRQSGQEHWVPLAGVFVQIGLVPNTEWLKGLVELTPHGEVVVDARGQTSVPGLFAAGDATTSPYKQIVVAAGDGAKAALGAFDYLIRGGAHR